MTEETRRFFEAEIGNEDVGGVSRNGSSSPGGANPATLETALVSWAGGYTPNDHQDFSEVGREIYDLIKKHGEDKELEELLDEVNG